RAIDRSGAVLENALPIMEWNLDKRYLRDLSANGIAIVPSVFRQRFDAPAAADLFTGHTCDEIVIKPCVSANADDTFRLNAERFHDRQDELSALFDHRPHLMQPFVPSVVQQGEYSLFYFNGLFSHCVLKTPKPSDFRVQEEHGGILKSLDPCDELLEAGHRAVTVLKPVPLYARIDLVLYQGHYALMEIELIEPSLYFNLDGESPRRFTEAFVDRMAMGQSRTTGDPIRNTP
ncbi:MAG: ATP-grasp domain-containing protein, partial [Planctomycetota bacterium]